MQQVLMVISPKSIEDMRTLKKIVDGHDSIKYVGLIDVSNNIFFKNNYNCPNSGIVYCIEVPEDLLDLEDLAKDKVSIGEFSAYFDPAYSLQEYFDFGKDLNRTSPDLLDDDVLFNTHIAQLKSSNMPDLVIFDKNDSWVPLNKQ